MKYFKTTLLFTLALTIIGCGNIEYEDCNDVKINNTLVNLGKSEAQFTVEAEENLKKIKKLVEDAMLKKKSNVVYITAGDSTRDSYHAAQYYWYKNRLAPFNITYHHESQSAIRAEDWASNKFKSSGGKCLDNAVTASTGEEGSTTILEYSLGINDTHKKNSTPEEWEKHIKFGITEFQRLKPKALIFLVVPVTTYSEEHNIALKNIYIKISKELHLPLLNQKSILKNKFDNPNERVKYYSDNIHPNYFGAIRLIDYIIYNITSNESKKYIKWNPLHINRNHSTRNLAEGKSVKKSLWQTETGIRVDSENYRSLDEISVIGNSLLKIKHEGNLYSTVIKDKNNQAIGHFDTGKLRFSDKLKDNEPYKYNYLYLPPEASSIGINIYLKAEDNQEYIQTVHPTVEYIVNDLANISRDDIYADLNITK